MMLLYKKQKNSADKGVSAVTQTMRRPLGEKRFMYGKIIGENILRSMLAIQLLYCLANLLHFNYSISQAFFQRTKQPNLHC